jgi:hypothetical protein
VHPRRHPRLQSARFQHDAIRRKRVKRLQLRLPGQYQPQPCLHRGRVRVAGLRLFCAVSGAILRGHQCGQDLSARRHHPDGVRPRCQREPGRPIPDSRADRQPAGGNGHGRAEPDADEFQSTHTDANAQQNSHSDADIDPRAADSLTYSVTGDTVSNSDANEHRDGLIDANLHAKPNFYSNFTPDADHYPEHDSDADGKADCHTHANRSPDSNAVSQCVNDTESISLAD